MMVDRLPPEVIESYTERIADAEREMAYAVTQRVNADPEEENAPAWWHGDEEASDRVIGWQAQAGQISEGIQKN